MNSNGVQELVSASGIDFLFTGVSKSSWSRERYHLGQESRFLFPRETHLLRLLREGLAALHHHVGAGRRVLRQVDAGHPLPTQRRVQRDTVFPHLVKKLNTGLHVMIIIFLCVAISFALISFGFCILNIIQVPYRAIKGPAGICLWNLLAGGFTALAVASFIAAVKLHHLTERIANFQENFQFVVLEEQYEGSFWLCVASATAHGVNLLLIALSAIHFPEFKTKTEEANVTAEDIMY
uniref:Clarin 2 n=1 Tax=Crocodylus porosus TaxID=8502 RepID=A0A7M4E9Z7_CROPO